MHDRAFTSARSAVSGCEHSGGIVRSHVAEAIIIRNAQLGQLTGSVDNVEAVGLAGEHCAIARTGDIGRNVGSTELVNVLSAARAGEYRNIKVLDQYNGCSVSCMSLQ